MRAHSVFIHNHYVENCNIDIEKQTKEYRKKNKDKIAENQAEYRKKNKDKKAEYNKKNKELSKL